MSKRKVALYSIATVLIWWLAAAADAVAQGTIDPCKSTATVNPGVVLVCPKGDGDPLTSPIGGGNCQITLTLRDNTTAPVPGVPAEDMWLVGCDNGLLLCGFSSGSSADAPTNAQGQTTFSNEPVAGGCDAGVYVVFQALVVQDPVTCMPKCFLVAGRSPDYKSSGAPGPPPCAGDIRCPDLKVSNADFSWFVTHYPSASNPGATYFACADFATPLGAPIGLADFAKFSIHFAGAGHKCPM